MRFKSHRQLSVGFISLGCSKNLVDSEEIAFDIARHGFVLARTPETADILIINTCAFIEDAKKESIASILAACDWKRKAAARLVIVAGCLPQRYRKELQKLMPDVDAFVGVDQLREVSAIIRRVMNGQRGIIEVSRRPRLTVNPSPDRILFTDAPYAYVKIIDAVVAARPAAARGVFIKHCVVSSTMGPGLHVQVREAAVSE